MKVYFISGLAADSRIFRHIRLPDGFEPVYLDWIKPLKNESLGDYSIRISENVDHNERFALVGVSMGGMIASEIARRNPSAYTILISSIPLSAQLPYFYKIAYRLRLHRLIPVSIIKKATLLKRLFTAESGSDKDVLRQVIRDSDPEFIRWAIKAIMKWDNKIAPPQLWQIHGEKDGIIPIRYTTPSYRIAGGSHMMIMTKAREINRLLEKVLTQQC